MLISSRKYLFRGLERCLQQKWNKVVFTQGNVPSYAAKTSVKLLKSLGFKDCLKESIGFDEDISIPLLQCPCVRQWL